MYTQCPDCGTSFRVTAVVLKQAAGKVRCGGCGNPFNALAHLSETKPGLSARVEPDRSLPELTPDPVDTKSEEAPSAISPEQSAALLKTLDQLAGEEIRLEDTGIEWRVLDDNDDVREEQSIDEFLDNAPTKVDEFLTKTPTEVEAGEIFEDPVPSIVEAVEVFEGADDPVPSIVEAVEVFEGADEPATQTSAEELRFDDNTGLPEDFDFDSVPLRRSTDPKPEPAPEPVAEPESMQVDLAFGDPDEWGELLGEVAVSETETESETEGDDSTSEPSIEEELAAIDDSHNDAVGSEAPLDIDTQFGMQAEAMGIDLSGMHKRADSVVDEDEDEEEDEDEVIIDSEVDEEIDKEIETEDDVEAHDETGEEDIEEETIVDTGQSFPDSTGALEFEISKAQEAAAQPDVSAEEETSIDDDLMAAAFESERAQRDAALDETALQIEEDEEPGRLIEEEDEGPELLIEKEGEGLEDETPEEAEEIIDFDDIGEIEKIDEQDLPTELDGKFDASIESLEIRLDGDEEEDREIVEHIVPPLSEEEQTINMQIDADLLSMAIEDEDGFASTIVIEDRKVESKAHEEKETAANKAKSPGDLSDTSSGFETIIMEGEFVRSAMEQEKLAADAKARSATADTKFVLPKEVEKDVSSGSKRNYAMIAGIVVLVLVLIGQFVHQSRTALAKVPIINNAIGPVYRAIGVPISPDWNVKGWRFEVTKGSTNPIGEFINGEAEATDVDAVDGQAELITSEDETLTIYSRIGNQSDDALPYPLVSVALTDRFLEIIGSKVLEPHEYLAGNFDPRVPVPPGSTFNAVISIDSPSVEATGFKLNVCYRQDGGMLRCAIEDFK